MSILSGEGRQESERRKAGSEHSMFALGKGIAAAAAAILLVACEGAASDEPRGPVTEPAPLPELIYTVDAVELALLQKFPLALEIRAKGTARTGGWSGAYLKRLDEFPGEPGVMSFSFVAMRPSGPVTMALAPLEAAPFLLDPLPDEIKRIRVVAETNERIVEINR
jgi:hypothetical protein